MTSDQDDATGLSPEAVLRFRREFPGLTRKVHLNTCSLGPLSLRSRLAVQEFLDLWEEHGAAAWYRIWLGQCAALRQSFAQLIGATGDEIALHGCVSTALAAVAGALDYSGRNVVVVADLDFPTIAYQWLTREQEGVRVRYARSDDGISVPLERFEALIDDRTALVATSHVFFTSGAIQNLAALADLAHRHGALLLIDAYQSTGQVPLDVQAAGVDFLVSGGLKWLLGGPGLAYLYIRKELLSTLRPVGSGWFAAEDQFSFDPQRFSYKRDARRMEAGTPALAAVYAGRGGLEILHEVGVHRARSRTLELVDLVEARALAQGLALGLPARRSDRSGIVTIRLADPAPLVKHLAGQGIITDYRPGLLRISPFFYNTEEEIEQLFLALQELGSLAALRSGPA